MLLKEAVEKARAELGGVPEVDYLLNFIGSSNRGITR
jgi:hypothetical protein